jgi:hypothetical protein
VGVDVRDGAADDVLMLIVLTDDLDAASSCVQKVELNHEIPGGSHDWYAFIAWRCYCTS